MALAIFCMCLLHTAGTERKAVVLVLVAWRQQFVMGLPMLYQLSYGGTSAGQAESLKLAKQRQRTLRCLSQTITCTCTYPPNSTNASCHHPCATLGLLEGSGVTYMYMYKCMTVNMGVSTCSTHQHAAVQPEACLPWRQPKRDAQAYLKDAVQYYRFIGHDVIRSRFTKTNFTTSKYWNARQNHQRS